MKYTCMLVDDEPLAHKILERYIRQTDELLIVKQCYTAEDARQYIRTNAVDILFLDIEMPEETGIALLQSLPKMPVTIFTTAFLHYSLEGFELGVIDYLVKPIRKERFDRAVKRATDILQLLQLQSGKYEMVREDTNQGGGQSGKYEMVHEDRNQGGEMVREDRNQGGGILVKTGTKKVLLSRKAITHVQAFRDYAIIYCGDKKYIVRSTMKEMEEILGAAGFLRVHKSFIIAKARARFFSAGRIEFENFEIPVGRKYKKDVERCFGGAGEP